MFSPFLALGPFIHLLHTMITIKSSTKKLKIPIEKTQEIKYSKFRIPIYIWFNKNLPSCWTNGNSDHIYWGCQLINLPVTPEETTKAILTVIAA